MEKTTVDQQHHFLFYFGSLVFPSRVSSFSSSPRSPTFCDVPLRLVVCPGVSSPVLLSPLCVCSRLQCVVMSGFWLSRPLSVAHVVLVAASVLTVC